MRLSFSTRARSNLGITFKTLPRFPLSSPAITITRSFFLTARPYSTAMIILRSGNPRRETAAKPRSTIWELGPILLVLDHLWRQGNNLHELGVTELSRYRAKDPCANRVILLVQEHSGVSIEFDVGSIRAPKFLCGPDQHRPHHLPLLPR